VNRNTKIACAISAALAACAQAAIAADEEQPAPQGGIQEVTVTAQRREQSVQDVPITVQAITGDQLRELGVVSTTDLLKYTPNVTYSGNGPGTGNVFVRGMGGIGSGNQSQSTTAAFPNVALYLDDQSMQFPARNNDVYLVDMERVEVLEGPQGTLFGGGAEAGAIRYITNKPKLGATSGEFNAGYGLTEGGDPNNNLNAVLNLPLIPDTLGVRAVIFSERRGGYIDNVRSTISYPAGSVPATLGGNPTANNGPLVANNTNPLTYGGGRVSVLWKPSDSWSVLLQQNVQQMEADGYFYSYPFDSNGTALAPYQIAAFTPAFTKDKYESTALTVTGTIADLSVVYTGSYMRRHIEGQQDYSNYMRSTVGSYYGCIGTGALYFNPANLPALKGSPLQCYASVGDWHDDVRNTHQSHEIRISTPTDWRLRALVGSFWEKFVIYDDMNFNYLPIPQCDAANLAVALAGGADCLSAVGPMPGTFANDPSTRTGENTAFGEDIRRGYKQLAFFASVDFDLIPKVLTVTGGTRWFKYDEFEEGSEYYTESTSALVVNHPNGACTAAGGCGFPIDLHKHESGTRSRANVSWHITPDMMAYYTFSQGFRPGGFNRTSSPGGVVSLAAVAPYTRGVSSTKQFLKPVGYDSDNLINNEIGFKSEFLDHHLLLNLSAYQMNWNNIQISLFDPVHLGNTTFNVNGPSYTIKGFEVQLVAQITDGLRIEGSSSYNSAQQTSAPCLRSAGVTKKTSANPTPAGQCITQVNSVPYSNPFGQLNTAPAFSPPWMFNLRARYDWQSAAGLKPFLWVGVSHIAAMSNEPANFPSGDAPGENPPTTTLLRYEIPSLTTLDGGLGVTKDQWTAQLTGSNLTNEYGPTNITSGEFIKAEVPLRPRVISLQLGYRF
jgi:outer membrane receptor protein involved in Fe transport